MSDVNFSQLQNQTDYISIVVTYYNGTDNPNARRWELLENCIDSIHKHADYPFEIIVMDDEGIKLNSLNVKNKVSTYILNMGDPLGPNVQMNRGISVASSKYILHIQEDVEVTKPCFKDLVNILEMPYIGFINGEGIVSPEERLISNDTEFCIGGSIAGAWFTGLRKDVWREIGKWPEWSHASAPPFCFRILKHGYWRGWFVGDRVARNVDVEEYNGNRTSGKSIDNMHYPKVFKLDTSFMNRDRKTICKDNFNDWRQTEGSCSNFKYWEKYTNEITGNLNNCVSSISWKAAQQHGQANWKNEILATPQNLQ